jgi:hypothetical protein
MRRTAALVVFAVLAATAAEAAPRVSLPSVGGILETATLASFFRTARVDADASTSSETRKRAESDKGGCPEDQKAEDAKKKERQAGGGAAAAGPEPVYLAF